MTVNFALLAFDQIVNSAAHIRYMFGGQVSVPLVIRMPQGAGHQLGPTHSHCLEAMFLHVPGLLVAVPSTPADAKGLLKTAIRDENPVIFIEHESLYGIRGEVPEDEDVTVDFGHARIAREGADVTIVGVSRMALTAERAAETLAQEHGVEAEVIDPRTLRPLDLDTILASVQQDQPLRRRRGGLAARGRRREPRGADRRARLRRPRRAGRARVRRRRADALFEAAGGHRLPARAPDRPGGAREPRSAPEQRLRELTLDGRDRDAAAVGHDGGGHDPQLARRRRRAGQPRPGARRDRDRQGEHDLRVRPGGRPADDRRRGRHAAGRRARSHGSAVDEPDGRYAPPRQPTKNEDEPASRPADVRAVGEGPAKRDISGGIDLRRRARPVQSTRASERLKASPVARRIASEKRDRSAHADRQWPGREDRQGGRARAPAAKPPARRGTSWE